MVHLHPSLTSSMTGGGKNGWNMDSIYPPGNENISHLGKFGKSSTQICRKSGGYVHSLEGVQCDFDMIRSLPDNSFDHEIDSSVFPDHTKRTRLVRGDSGETR